MPGEIFEWFGYRASDQSPAARASAEHQQCPFLGGRCTKVGGVCSVRPTAAPEFIAVCPNRMYFAGHWFLRRIADMAFARLDVTRGVDGLPEIVAGDRASAAAAASGQHQVGVFGRGFAGEIRLPPAVLGGARYSVDFTVVAISPTGSLAGFVVVEVQSIDTTNNYRVSLAALQHSRATRPSAFGMNWENVNKRILPQLIVKGLMLQGEALCTTGMYFVTPEAVYQRVMQRLGGAGRLREIPPQPGSITFLRFEHQLDRAVDGTPVPMKLLPTVTVSTSDLSLAFITPENLPPAGSYEREITPRL